MNKILAYSIAIIATIEAMFGLIILFGVKNIIIFAVTSVLILTIVFFIKIKLRKPKGNILKKDIARWIRVTRFSNVSHEGIYKLYYIPSKFERR